MLKIGKYVRITSILVGVTILLVLGARLTNANGGQLRIDQERIGPYVVSVTTNPTPLREGLIDVSVLVGDPNNNAYLENAEINVLATSLDHEGVSISHQASHDQASEDRYQAAEFELPESGRWEFTISVNGPDGGGTTSFEADVAGKEGFDWLTILPVLLVIPVVFGIAGYLITRNRDDDLEEAESQDGSS